MQLNRGSPPAPTVESTGTPGSTCNTRLRTVGPAPSVPTLLFGIPIRSFDQRLPESPGRKTNASGAGRSGNTFRTLLAILSDLPAVTRASPSMTTSNIRPSSRISDSSHFIVSRNPNVATSRSVRGALPTAKPSRHAVSEDHAPPRGTRPSSRHDLSTGEPFTSTPPFWPLSAFAAIHHISLLSRSPDTHQPVPPTGSPNLADPCPTATEARAPIHEVIEISSDSDSSVCNAFFLVCF